MDVTSLHNPSQQKLDGSLELLNNLETHKHAETKGMAMRGRQGHVRHSSSLSSQPLPYLFGRLSANVSSTNSKIFTF